MSASTRHTPSRSALASRTAAIAVTALFAVNGLLLGGYGGALPSLRVKLDLSYSDVAILLFLRWGGGNPLHADRWPVGGCDRRTHGFPWSSSADRLRGAGAWLRSRVRRGRGGRRTRRARERRDGCRHERIGCPGGIGAPSAHHELLPRLLLGGQPCGRRQRIDHVQHSRPDRWVDRDTTDDHAGDRRRGDVGRADQDHSGGGCGPAHRRRGAYPHSADGVAARRDGVGLWLVRRY